MPEQFIFDPASNLLGMGDDGMASAVHTHGERIGGHGDGGNSNGGNGNGENAGENATHSSRSHSTLKPQVQGNRLAFQGDQHFQYDLLGRRTKKTWGKQGTFKQHYQYDAQHRLVQVTTQKRSQPQYKTVAQYTYDALGRRIGKTVIKTQGNGHSTQHTTQFYWLGDTLFGEITWDQSEPAVAPRNTSAANDELATENLGLLHNSRLMVV